MLLRPERYRGRIVTPTDIAKHSIAGWTDEQVKAYAITLITDNYRNTEWGREEYESDREDYLKTLDTIAELHELPRSTKSRLRIKEEG